MFQIIIDFIIKVFIQEILVYDIVGLITLQYIVVLIFGGEVTAFTVLASLAMWAVYKTYKKHKTIVE